MDLHRDIAILLIATFNCGAYSDEIPGWQSNYLDSFRFIPILGDCYQLYHRNDLVSSCRRDLENQSCIQWVSDDRECIGLVTPTNETVTFRCTSNIRFDKCFEVYDFNQNVTTVCQEIIEGHGVGITTPDNFTIILHSLFCRAATSGMERQVYADFVNNFSLDAEARSCYKVYNPEEVLTPYNCLSKAIHTTCVFGMEGGCTALMTQNNEVLLLDCPHQGQRQQNCFYLYTPDNQVHTVCQKTVEERCVGVVTPSNLTVLFECFFCSESMTYIYYNRERQRMQRHFVKSYLENGYQGRNLPLLNSQYEVFNDNLESFNSLDTFSYWIPKTSCLGVTLESNETIILECIVSKEMQEQFGCFELITPENEKQSVCLKILNEACVGITTPGNLSVALACYNADKNYLLEYDRQEWLSILHTLEDFINNRYSFHSSFSYNAYKENGTNQQETKVYHVQKLDDQPNCIGILTETEKIVLSCTDRKIEQNGCFNVTKLEYNANNKESDANEQVDDVCVKVLDSGCVGIITPDNWIMQFSCVTQFAAGQASSGTTKEFITNMAPKTPVRLRRNLL